MTAGPLYASLLATYGHPNCTQMLSLLDPNPPLVVTNGKNSQLQELDRCQSPRGNIPTLGNPPIRYPMLFYHFWHHAKNVGKLPTVSYPTLPSLYPTETTPLSPEMTQKDIFCHFSDLDL